MPDALQSRSSNEHMFTSAFPCACFLFFLHAWHHVVYLERAHTYNTYQLGVDICIDSMIVYIVLGFRGGRQWSHILVFECAVGAKFVALCPAHRCAGFWSWWAQSAKHLRHEFCLRHHPFACTNCLTSLLQNQSIVEGLAHEKQNEPTHTTYPHNMC